jgi:hypothetical protein
LKRSLRIREGPEYRPFRDLREQVENHGRPVRRSFFLHKAELGFFHILEIVTGWLVTFRLVRTTRVQPGWYLPPQKIRLAENRFLQAGKGAENTKAKIQAVLLCIG